MNFNLSLVFYIVTFGKVVAEKIRIFFVIKNTGA